MAELAGIHRQPRVNETLPMWMERLGAVDVLSGFLKLDFSKNRLVSCPAIKYRMLQSEPPAGSRAALEPEKYPRRMEDCIYALLKLTPELVKAHRGLCWNFSGSSEDWFITCYSPAVIEPEFQHGSPYGHFVMLSRWEVPDGSKIDTYEPKPYRRKTIAFDTSIKPGWALPKL